MCNAEQLRMGMSDHCVDQQNCACNYVQTGRLVEHSVHSTHSLGQVGGYMDEDAPEQLWFLTQIHAHTLHSTSLTKKKALAKESRQDNVHTRNKCVSLAEVVPASSTLQLCPEYQPAGTAREAGLRCCVPSPAAPPNRRRGGEVLGEKQRIPCTRVLYSHTCTTYIFPMAVCALSMS